MPTINHVELLGSLSRDPQPRTTSQGKPYTEFFLTVNHNLHSTHTDCNEPGDRFLINAPGNLGEMCLRELEQDQLVQIEGQLHSQYHEDTLSGELRICTIVVATRVQMLNYRPYTFNVSKKTCADAEAIWLAV